MSRLISTLAVTSVFLANSLGFGQATNPAQNQNQNPNHNNNQATTGTTVRGKVLRVEGQDRIIVQTPDNKEVILIPSATT